MTISHLFGDNPDAAADRKTLQDAYRAKHDVRRCAYESCRGEYEPERSSADNPDRFCDDACESNAAAYASGYGIAQPAPFEVPAGASALADSGSVSLLRSI